MATMAKAGLEDVIACTSAICEIDGVRGKLYYRGYDTDELVDLSFEAVCHLLWTGELADAGQLAALRRSFAEERRLPDETIALL
ncbi:MAG TPA: citrate/2-methylcitrate synthase, partial [Dehalococcoidia bacterium]